MTALGNIKMRVWLSIIFLQLLHCCMLEAADFSSCLHSNRPTTSSATSTTLNPPVVFGLKPRGGGIQQQQKSHQKNNAKKVAPRAAAAKSSNNNKAVSSASSRSTSVLSKKPPQQETGPIGNCIKWSRQNALALSLTAIILTVAYRERQVWMPILLDRERLQEETLRLLRKYLKPEDSADDANAAAVWKSLTIYAIVMAVWEFLGLSTIPVETAAAVVFGWPALLASGAGKLTGASASFIVGRTLLRQWVQQQKAVQDNVVFQILQQDHAQPNDEIPGHSPLQTALFMKFSCFPELIKNMGSGAILSDKKLNFWAFLLATAFHGLGFTALWTWVGVESAAAATLTTTTTTASKGSAGMHVALLVAGAMGLILSPALMAWWIRDLRRLQKEALEKKRR